MNKKLPYFSIFVILISVVFLTSCVSNDNAKPPAPTVEITIINGDGNFERSDLITYVIKASLPGGFKQGSSGVIQPSGVGSNTPFPADVALRGDTTILDTMFLILARGAAMGTHRLFVDITDESNQNVSSETSYTVVPTGQGGGGTVPLLRGKATVDLGTEGNNMWSSYLASINGTVYQSGDVKANQANIDITFGVGNTGGPSLISPDQRSIVGLTAGNPVMDAPRTTFFKLEENGPTDLNLVRAIEVANDITASSNKNIQITANTTYSFVQGGTSGKKGYIRVLNLSGSGTDYTAQIEFIVQQ
ncbi:hypothetical protein BKI52_12965 [marine bacterium AO1-C]|nr:hypothetical protein BKI52_12965 [marine bacterium AO1-C]